MTRKQTHSTIKMGPRKYWFVCFVCGGKEPWWMYFTAFKCWSDTLRVSQWEKEKNRYRVHEKEKQFNGVYVLCPTGQLTHSIAADTVWQKRFTKIQIYTLLMKICFVVARFHWVFAECTGCWFACTRITEVENSAASTNADVHGV